MAYVSLYNRWRPQNFAAIVGQQAVKQALENAITSGRIAHAYLFSGPRGTGKTSTARILAKALNCEQGPTAEPCGHCQNCERITAGTSMDVIELDAASNRGIDDIKNLQEQMAFAPVDGKYKIYIIDEVHMLTTEAFNALLKTLEEPPVHVIFILATTDPHKIPPTIHSRCQRFDFHRITIDDIVEHLELVAANSNIQAEKDALRLIAIQAEGGMRDALSLLDQCGVMATTVTTETVRQVLGIVGREALRSLIKAIGSEDLGLGLQKLSELMEQGKAVKQILTELAEYLRALLLYKAAPDFEEVYLTDTQEALDENARLFGQERILAAEERIHQALQELKGSMRPRIVAELCLFELCRNEGSGIAALKARLEKLEQQIATGTFVSTSRGSVPNGVSASPTTPLSLDKPGNALQAEANYASPAAPAREKEAKAIQVTVKASKKPAAASTPSTSGSADQPTAPTKAVKSNTASAKPSAAPIEDYSGDWATGEDYWRQALEILNSEKKISVVSCAKHGRVVGFENSRLVVAFKVQFLCDRMNKDDYRQILEEVILRIARQSVHLECIMEGASVKTSAPQKSKKTSPAPEKKAESVPNSFQGVMSALGGTVKNIEHK